VNDNTECSAEYGIKLPCLDAATDAVQKHTPHTHI